MLRLSESGLISGISYNHLATMLQNTEPQLPMVVYVGPVDSPYSNGRAKHIHELTIAQPIDANTNYPGNPKGTVKTHSLVSTYATQTDVMSLLRWLQETITNKAPLKIIVSSEAIGSRSNDTRTIQISGDNVEVQIMNSRGWEDELAKHYLIPLNSLLLNLNSAEKLMDREIRANYTCV